MVVANCWLDASPPRVTSTEGRVWAQERGFAYMEADPVSGRGIDELFSALLAQILSNTLPKAPQSLIKAARDRASRVVGLPRLCCMT